MRFHGALHSTREADKSVFQHFHGRYYTGEVKDCNSPNCKSSKAHRHTARNCGCINVRPYLNRTHKGLSDFSL